MSRVVDNLVLMAMIVMRPCDKNSRRGSRRLRTVISLETDFFNQTVLVIEKNRKNVYPSLMESAQHLINVYLYRERKNNLIVVNEIVMKRLHVQSAASRHLHVNGKMHLLCVLNRNKKSYKTKTSR